MTRLKLWAVIAGAAVVAFLAAFLRGRASGVADAKKAAQARAHEALKARREVTDELESESPDDRRRRLDGWMRDDR